MEIDPRIRLPFHDPDEAEQPYAGAARPGGSRSLEPLGSPATLTTTPARLGRLRWICLAKTLTEAMADRSQKLRRSRDARTW